MKKLLLIVLLGALTYTTLGSSLENLISNAAVRDKKNCSRVKAKIKINDFLEANKAELNLSGEQINELENNLSSTCLDGVHRFINIAELLSASDLKSSQVISVANSMALSDNKTVMHFKDTFKKAYLKKYLDLKVEDAALLALGVSINDDPTIKNEFEEVAKTCADEKGKKIQLPLCKKMITEISERSIMPKKEFPNLIQLVVNLLPWEESN